MTLGWKSYNVKYFQFKKMKQILNELTLTLKMKNKGKGNEKKMKNKREMKNNNNCLIVL